MKNFPILSPGDSGYKQPLVESRPRPRKGTLERFIFELLKDEPGPFNVIAYELTNDGDGWSVNTPFRIASGVDLPGVMEAARGRWEVFRANYSPRATVKGMEDIGYDHVFELESDFVSFLSIRPSKS